jgi:hypothetical protein
VGSAHSTSTPATDQFPVAVKSIEDRRLRACRTWATNLVALYLLSVSLTRIPCKFLIRGKTGEFHVPDVDVAARRLLTMIDGLGAQKVVRAVPSDEIKHIARAYFASELGVAGSTS